MSRVIFWKGRRSNQAFTTKLKKNSQSILTGFNGNEWENKNDNPSMNSTDCKIYFSWECLMMCSAKRIIVIISSYWSKMATISFKNHSHFLWWSFLTNDAPFFLNLEHYRNYLKSLLIVWICPTWNEKNCKIRKNIEYIIK